MLRRLVFWTALCAYVLPVVLFAQATSVTPITPTQTLSPGATANLMVRVTDLSGAGVASQLVNFTTSAAGAVFLTSSVQYTDQNGYAQTLLTVPSVSGVYVAYAYAGTLSPATFVLYVGTGGTIPTPGTGTGMAVRSGNGQVVSFLAPTTPRPLTVVVKDSSGNKVPGAYVTWQVTSGVAGLLQSTCVADGNGECGVLVQGNMTATPGVTYQQATIMAYSSYGTVNFVLTTLGMTTDQQPIGVNPQLLTPTTDTPIVGKSGQTTTDAIRVLVYTSNNSIPLPNVGLDVIANQDPEAGPVAACSNTNTLTDAAGYAKCDLTFGRRTGEGTLTVNVGSVLIRTLTFTVTAGDPSQMVVISGDGQTGRPGQTLPQPLVAEVRDSQGNVLEGVNVLWEWGVTDPAGARLLNPSQKSDSSGRVSASVMLGTRPGDLVVRVRAASVLSVMATFTLKSSLPVAGLAKISGDNQTAITSQAFANPLVVEVRDAQSIPLAGVTVTFAASGGATLGSATAVTGSDGRASTTVRAGATAGSITVTATADSQSVSFSLTARLPGPQLTASSFLNGASFRPGLVPGSITAIVGPGLAPGLQGCAGPGTVVGPMPFKVADVEVQFGSSSAPILAVCNVSGQEQVVVQAPWDLAPGFTTMVKVSVGGGATVVDRVPVLAALPGIFETSESGMRLAVAIGSDGRLINLAQRARKGEIVYIYATGLGTVLPLAATNVPGSGQKPWFSLVAGIAARGVRVVSAEYAAGLIGVYVIAIEIPSDAPSGIDVPLALGVVTAEGQAPIFAADSKLPIQ